MPRIYGYLVLRDDHSLFMRERPEWAYEDIDYNVIELVAKGEELTNADADGTVKLLEELFELEEAQIDNLKSQITECRAIVESISDVSTPTDHLIECKAKLLLIGEQCKRFLIDTQ